MAPDSNALWQPENSPAGAALFGAESDSSGVCRVGGTNGDQNDLDRGTDTRR
jgi:hypothetical protein